MKKLALPILLASGLLSLTFFATPEPDQKFLTNPQKLLEKTQKELDKVLERYENKLDDQLEKYEDKIDDQIGRLDSKVSELEQKLEAKVISIEQKLDDQVSKAESRLDQTFDKVDAELGDVKTALLGTVGTIAWRFTIVEIITATLATFLTAFFAAYLTARKVKMEKFREEMEAVIRDLRIDKVGKADTEA